MNKPDTDELRRIANTYYPNSVYTYLHKLADFIDSLEGKHICEWPKHLTREHLNDLANSVMPLKMADRTEALKALASIAPKKRMVEIWKDETDGLLYVRGCGLYYNKSVFRKVGGPFEVDE